MTWALHHGDCVAVLRERLSDRSVDMVYADPPFGNEQTWTGRAGSFSDKWRWNEASAEGWAALRRYSADAADLMAAVARSEKSRSYLGMMAGVMLELRRVLRLTGTLWLHFDDTMGAELRVLGDAIFGPENQLGLVVWQRARGKNNARHFGRNHDTIACFARSRAARARLSRIGDREFVHGGFDHPIFVDGFADDLLGSAAKERVGYPTQKPVALLERLVRAASLPGDTVLDPMCGSGTTLVAATNLGRRAVGIDQSPDAIAVAEQRLGQASAQPDLFGIAA